MDYTYTILNQDEIDADKQALVVLEATWENGAQMKVYKTQAEWRVIQIQEQLYKVCCGMEALVDEFKEAIIDWRRDEETYFHND